MLKFNPITGLLDLVNKLISPTIFIAASNATDQEKSIANIVCDGTADENDINTAFSQGKSVELSTGTFNLTAATINLISNGTLKGQGFSTILKIGNSLTINAITGSNKANFLLKDFSIDGNLSNQTPVGNEDIQNGIYLDTCTNGKITNIWANNCAATGITLGQNNTNMIVMGNHTLGNNRNGIYLWFSNNNYNTISNNICSNSVVFHGIGCSSGISNTFSGNICQNNGFNGIDLDGNSTNNTVMGNTCNANQGRGIVIRAESGTPLANTIASNTCSLNLKDGIQLDGAQNNTVASNMCYNNSQGAANFYSGILVAYETMLSHGTGNQFIGNFCSVNQGYGLNIDDAAATGNVATGNNLSGNVSAYQDLSGDLKLLGNKGVDLNNLPSALIPKGIGLGLGGFIDSTKILNIDHTIVPTTDTYGFFTQLRENAGSNNSNFHFGGFIGAQILAGNTKNYTGGIRGASLLTEHKGSGTVAQAFGVDVQSINGSTGAVTSAIGINVDAPVNSGGGTVVSYTGVYIQRPTVAGANNALVSEGGNVVFNDFVTDSDFTIRSDNVFSFFNIDASADKLQLDGGAIGYFGTDQIVFNDFSQARNFTVRGNSIFELLKVDAGGTVTVNGVLNVSTGASGTFAAGSKTITVTGGLVTSIV